MKYILVTDDHENVVNKEYSTVWYSEDDEKVWIKHAVTGPNNNEIWYWTTDGLSAQTSQPPGITSLNTMGLASNTYENGKGVMTFDKPVTEIGNLAFATCESLRSITIPNSVTSIGNNAFGFCTGFSSVTIPDNVTSIDYGAFQNCTSLSSVTYKGTKYTSKSALTTALTNNGVTVQSNVFYNTALSA